jgi:hypothetical protein
MTRRLLSACALVGVLLTGLIFFQPGHVDAQATINTTTLNAAQSATGSGPSTINLASATTVAVGQMVYVDRELELITATTPTSTIFTVTRGFGGTQRQDHASGAAVFTGPPSYFNQSAVLYEPAGPCTAAAQISTPTIYVQSGNIYQCNGGFWAIIRRGGLPDGQLGRLGNGNTSYVASGAITPEPGVVWLNNASGVAMTIVDPTIAQNGMMMCVFAQSTGAHTLTYTAGFNGGTTARDVATWTSAVGNGMCFIARAGTWYTTLLQGVALG